MTRKLLISTAAATAAVVAMAGSALAADGRGFGMHRGRGGHPFFGLLLLVLVAGVAVLGTWLLLGRRRPASVPAVPLAAPPAAPATASPTAHAEAILAERLARSEISPDEYRAALAAMRDGAVPATASEAGPLPPPEAL